MIRREKMLGRLAERAFPGVTTAFPPYTITHHCVWVGVFFSIFIVLKN